MVQDASTPVSNPMQNEESIKRGPLSFEFENPVYLEKSLNTILFECFHDAVNNARVLSSLVAEIPCFYNIN